MLIDKNKKDGIRKKNLSFNSKNYVLLQGDSDSQEAKPLNLKSVGGVFWVSVGGIILASLLVFVEMILHVTKESIKNNVNFKEELKEEMKFYFKFKGMVKPVRNRKSCSKSPEQSNKSQENSPFNKYNLMNDVSQGKTTKDI